MTKYILICCYEREIEILGVYSTLELAYEEMRLDFISYLIDHGCDDIENEIKCNTNEAYETEECSLYTWCAWSNVQDLHVDWQIERIEV